MHSALLPEKTLENASPVAAAFSASATSSTRTVRGVNTAMLLLHRGNMCGINTMTELCPINMQDYEGQGSAAGQTHPWSLPSCSFSDEARWAFQTRRGGLFKRHKAKPVNNIIARPTYVRLVGLDPNWVPGSCTESLTGMCVCICRIITVEMMHKLFVCFEFSARGSCTLARNVPGKGSLTGIMDSQNVRCAFAKPCSCTWLNNQFMN